MASTSEALRLIQQGAVRIDGERVGDRNLELAVGSKHVYQVGKRRGEESRFCRGCECSMKVC